MQYRQEKLGEEEVEKINDLIFDEDERVSQAIAVVQYARDIEPNIKNALRVSSTLFVFVCSPPKVPLNKSLQSLTRSSTRLSTRSSATSSRRKSLSTRRSTNGGSMPSGTLSSCPMSPLPPRIERRPPLLLLLGSSSCETGRRWPTCSATRPTRHPHRTSSARAHVPLLAPPRARKPRSRSAKASSWPTCLSPS